VGAAVLWVVTAPRSLPTLTEYIEKELNSIKESYSFSIGDTILQWDGWEDNLSLHVINLKIRDSREDKEIASLPDIKVNLNIPGLFMGKIIFDESNILQPELRINIPKPDEIVTYGETKYNKFLDIYFSTVLSFLKEMDEIGVDIPIRDVGIKNGVVIVNNGVQEISWVVPEALMSLDFSEGAPSFDASVELFDEKSGRRSFLRVDAEDAREFGRVNIETEVTNVASSYIADIFPDFSWLAGLDINFSGKTKIIIDTLGVVDAIDFNILSQAEDDAAIGVSGKLEVYPEYKKYINIPAGVAKISIKNLFIEDIERFWPPDFAFAAREWVAANITDGVIHSGEATITLSPDDFIKGIIDKDALKGRIKYSGVKVEYLNDFPPIEMADGAASFDGESITFDIQKASMKNSEVQGILYISDIGSDEPKMEVDVTSVGKISDLSKFLTLVQKESRNPNPLVDINKLKGDAETSHFYKFPLRRDLTFDQVSFRAGAEMFSIFLPSVINDIDLSRGIFRLSVDKNGLSAEGTAYLNATTAKIKWEEDFTGKKKYSTEYLVVAYVTPEELHALGGPKLRNVNGVMESKLFISQKGDERDVRAVIDLKDTEINIPNLGWKKPIDEVAKLEFFVEDSNNKNYKIKKFNLTSKELIASGIAEIEKGKNPKSMIDFRELKIGKTDLQARIIVVGDNEYIITVKGKSFDATPVLDGISSGFDTEGEAISIDVDLLLEKMLLKNGEVIENVEGNVLCREGGCKTVAIQGFMGKKDSVEITLKPDNKNMVFSITSDNGGKILKGLNIHENIVGGKFITSATKPITSSDTPYEGKLIMRDFRVIKAPALTKVLTLASFSGIVDLMNGDGIIFDKLKGKYSFKNNILKLRDVKASGGSLAITIEGDVDFNTSDVKLQGNVVPATFLNKVLENIPFIGYALTGGGDESLIATRYTITGKFEDPDVTVNPFSILTPGFLRNIWGDVLENDDDDFESKKDKFPKDSETLQDPAPIKLY
jgi:hypothetical protein